MLKIFSWLFPSRRRVAPTLKAIFIAAKAGEAMQSVARIQAIAAAGLRGDRYSEAGGFWQATDACQVTLISEDDISQAKQGRPAILQDKLDNGSHRRNLVVGGIKTKQLEGKTFRIGQASFRYHKPRPPCAYLEKIEGQGMSRALGKHSGVCLYVIEGGEFSVGDTLEIIKTSGED
ncbi:MAG: MOSC domain-containing protein [Gammaproteobacteria bacterium]|nr:MOSC domain-containing protein [Gammaproteobacteria bacterium]